MHNCHPPTTGAGGSDTDHWLIIQWTAGKGLAPKNTIFTQGCHLSRLAPPLLECNLIITSGKASVFSIFTHARHSFSKWDRPARGCLCGIHILRDLPCHIHKSPPMYHLGTWRNPRWRMDSSVQEAYSDAYHGTAAFLFFDAEPCTWIGPHLTSIYLEPTLWKYRGGTAWPRLGQHSEGYSL